MDTTTERPARRGRATARRAARGGAVAGMAIALGLGLTAAPAAAARHDTCATARAVFRAHMNQARFWIGAADRLAAAGNDPGANAASAEAGYYLDLASGALDDMSGAC